MLNCLIVMLLRICWKNIQCAEALLCNEFVPLAACTSSGNAFGVWSCNATQAFCTLNVLYLLDRCQAFDRVRIALYHPDQDCGLRVRVGSPLFPVFQRPLIDVKITGKNGARQVEFLAQAEQLFCRYFRRWFDVNRVVFERDFACTFGSKRIKAFAQFCKQVSFHDLVLATISCSRKVFSIFLSLMKKPQRPRFYDRGGVDQAAFCGEVVFFLGRPPFAPLARAAAALAGVDAAPPRRAISRIHAWLPKKANHRTEEHTSELQSQS